MVKNNNECGFGVLFFCVFGRRYKRSTPAVRLQVMAFWLLVVMIYTSPNGSVAPAHGSTVIQQQQQKTAEAVDFCQYSSRYRTNTSLSASHYLLHITLRTQYITLKHSAEVLRTTKHTEAQNKTPREEVYTPSMG